jgi:hypothetical protein
MFRYVYNSLLEQNRDTLFKTIFPNLVWNTFHGFQTSAWDDHLPRGGIIWKKKKAYSVTKEKQIDLYKYGCKINNLTLQLYHVKNCSGSMQNKIVHPLFFAPVYLIDPREKNYIVNISNRMVLIALLKKINIILSIVSTLKINFQSII